MTRAEGQLQVSVVCPTYNRRELITELVQRLVEQSFEPSAFEVIVVVDGSSDGSEAALKALPTPFSLRVLAQPNSGRAAACNRGLTAAHGEIVLVLDDDMLPSPGLLRAHTDLHPAGSRRGVVGAAPIQLTSDSPPLVRYMGAKFNQHLAKLAAMSQIGFRDFYSGNFSIPREVLSVIGGFDEDFRVYGNEDGELALRMLEAGIEICFSPRALAEQRYRKTFAQVARDAEAKGRTAVILGRKHPSAAADLKYSRLKRRGMRSAARRALAHTATRMPGMSFVLAEAVSALDRAPQLAQRAYYAAVLDFYYWRGAIAALRELQPPARLRSIDWRFLLAQPHPARVVATNAAPQAEAFMNLGSQVVEPGAVNAQADLAVAVDPGRLALSQLASSLAPGGEAYVEFRRPMWLGILLAHRRLAAAGLDVRETYWRWPARRRKPQTWLSVASIRPARFLLSTKSRPSGTWLRAAFMARWLLIRAALTVGLVSPVAVRATKPLTAGQGRPDGAVHSKHGEPWFAAVTSGQSAEWILRAPGSRSISKLILLPLRDGEQRPTEVVKVSRSARAAAGLRNEAAMLELLHQADAKLTGVPRILSRGHRAGANFIAQTALWGQSLPFRPSHEEQVSVSRIAADWLVDLAHSTTQSGSGAPRTAIAAQELDHFANAYGGVVPADELHRAADCLRALDGLATVVEHRDFSPWNVFLKDEELVVLDWESARPDGLPGADLVYFLAHWTAHASGRTLSEAYPLFLDPASRAGALADSCFVDYAAALALDRALLPQLRLYTWTVHAMSEHRRIVEDNRGAALARALGRGTFLRLWRAEVNT